MAAHNGEIDKFVGDHIMAVFQGPAMAAAPLRCAVSMQQHMAELSAANPERDLSIGIGIDVSEVVMGRSAPETAWTSPCSGIASDVAARLCSAAKPRQTLATAAVVDAATASQPDLRLTPRALDPIALKGKSAPLQVYEIHPASQVMV